MKDENSDYGIEDYVHDVDGLVASIRNLSSFSGHERDPPFLAHRLGTINGLSAVLASKTAFMSFVNFDVQLEQVEIPVFRSVNRATSAAKYLAETEQRKQLTIRIVGESHGRLVGPGVFDFIPYVLLENAVKYSPLRGRITADVREDSLEFEIRVSSVGPIWDTDEADKLFDKSFRGRHAQRAASKGAGIGLYYAKKALDELYSGTIRGEQQEGPDIPINGVAYRNTTFILRIPK